MKSKFKFLIRYYIFWVFLSIVARIIFLIYQSLTGAKTLTGGEIFNIFTKGIFMDISLGGYMVLFSVLILIVSAIIKDTIIRKVLDIFTFSILILYWTISVPNMELFSHWKFHVNNTIWSYLATPKEALASTPFWLNLLLVLMVVILTFASWKIYKTFISNKLKYERVDFKSIPFLLLFSGLVFLGVRGGVNIAPMNPGSVFFSKENMYANQSAINPVWNFMYENNHYKSRMNSFNYMDDSLAYNNIKFLRTSTIDTTHLLRIPRPNIVFLLMESFTGEAVGCINGTRNATPNLDSIAKSGVLFSNIYATGMRSNRGMAATISGLPSHPDLQIIKYPEKVLRFPSFTKVLSSLGYKTKFYYAGDIDFGDFRSYATINFDSYVSEDDFSGEAVDNRFKWGIHDQYMFPKLFEDINNSTQPFMYMAFNISSHEPFNVPMKTVIEGKDKSSRFCNAIYYSDKCIGEFIKKCKKSKIWDNTLFVFISDHGTPAVNNLDLEDSRMYHIPMILAGGALAVQDTIIPVLGAQYDIIATLLAQLGVSHDKFKFSRDLLQKDAPNFAFSAYSNAAMIMTDKGQTVYRFQDKKIVKGSEGDLLKSFLQVVNKEENPLPSSKK